MEATDPVTQFLSRIGTKGGSVKSERKARAARRNAKKPRPNRRKKIATA